jgi:hypothetical protein
MRAISFLPGVVLALAAGFSSAEVLHGTPAMQGQSVNSTEGYLRATPVPGKPLEEKLDFWMTQPHSPTPIKSYQIEMTKKLHVVAVSSDFKVFLHIHPELNASGHFLLDQTFPSPGVYDVYADGLPNNSMQHQVFLFKLAVGGSHADPKPVLQPTPMSVDVGPYEVDLSNLRLHSGQMETISIAILENGQPAKDLHPYLGAPGHAVFLNSNDLSYVHVHPMPIGKMMDMSKPMVDMPDNASVNPSMVLWVAIREPGAYKLWLQFRGANNQLYIAKFTMYAS